MMTRPDTTRVYPRVCGGTHAVLRVIQADVGLSPRVRGNHEYARPGACGAWSIPACAGEPMTGPPRLAKSGVYPRVCGGTDVRNLAHYWFAGLSPRVRGNRLKVTSFIVSSGSIPACAGEPAPGSNPRRQKRVYPRVCGGTGKRIWAECAAVGLSPRVRGNHVGHDGAGGPGRGLSPRVRGNPHAPANRNRREGSIPACAGEPPQ